MPDEPKPGVSDFPAPPPDDVGRRALDRIVVVLYETQDLVNIALVVRAMKNMELTRLRLVAPLEFDPWRIEGIAHDTSEIVAGAEVFDRFEDAIRGAVRVVATTARRRAKRQEWSEPRGAAPAILERTRYGDVAVVFGREDRGIPNEILDLCDEAVCIPTNPAHPSLNLGHAAMLVFYELRQAARDLGGLRDRDLSGKPRESAPPATADEEESFFRVWELAMREIGMLRGGDEESKMRSYRRLVKRAEPDGREIRLLEATAWRVLRFARRTRARIEDELAATRDGEV